MNKNTLKYLFSLIPVFLLFLFIPLTVSASNEPTVVMSVEKFTIGQGYIVEPTRVALQGNDSAASVLDRLLTSKGISYEHKGTFTDAFYMYQINNGDNGRYVVPAAIKAMGDFTTAGGDHITAPTGQEINASFPDLSEFSYTQSAGWMYTVKDKNVSEKALSDYKPVDGDVIRLQFTLYGYGADLGLVYDNEDFPLKLPDRNEMTERLALMNQYKTKLMTNESFRKAYDRAMEAIVNINTGQTLMNQAMNALPTEEAIFQYLEEYDANAVDMVKNNIDSIGEVLDLSQETLIFSTRDAFYDLSETQQAEVGADRKAKLDNAVIAIQAIIDRNAADELADLIAAFGPVTLDKEADLLVIENMYENLTEGARACLTDATKEAFTAIKNVFEALKIQHEADIKAANSVANKIYAIGTVTLTKATRIRNIRKEYDDLSEGAKAIIPDSIYKILTDAEAELAVLEAKDAEEKAVDDVIAKINALGTITLSKESAVASARKAYDALSDDAKKMISSSVLSKLTAAEKKIADLKNEQALKKKYTPSKVVMKAPKPGKKKVKLTWKKVKNTTGYEIFMSAKKASGFKKIATIKKVKTVTFTKKKLKSKKIYYFRIRAYRKVGGKTYYGPYSAVKKVKIK